MTQTLTAYTASVTVLLLCSLPGVMGAAAHHHQDLRAYLHTEDGCMQLLHFLQAQPIEHLVGLISADVKLLSQMQVCCQDVYRLAPAAEQTRSALGMTSCVSGKGDILCLR